VIEQVIHVHLLSERHACKGKGVSHAPSRMRLGSEFIVEASTALEVGTHSGNERPPHRWIQGVGLDSA
jgi:hypothetical protein